MDLTGSLLVPASQQHTWDKLITPATLKACICGCEKLERVSDNEYLVGLRADVGPVSARFQGKLKLTDINAPNSYHLEFEGSGGPAGFAKGHADVSLTPDGNDTRVAYVAHADLGGKLSQLKTEQADKIARKMANSFFSLFSVCASRMAEKAEGHPARVQPQRTPETSRGWFGSELGSRFSWVLVGAVVLAIAAFHAFTNF